MTHKYSTSPSGQVVSKESQPVISSGDQSVIPKSKSSRVVLDKDSQEHLNKMLLTLKSEGSCIRISPSRLVSWIVSYFSKRDFSRQKKRIIREHFNSKEYLRHIAKNLNESDSLEAVLKETLNQIKPSKRRKNAKKEIGAIGSTDEKSL